MSDVSTKARAPSFFDLHRRGEAAANEIEDFVGHWHDGLEPWAGRLSLHEYLGLTRDEYEVLLCDAEALPQILKARELRCPSAGLMAARLRQLKAANRPEDGTTIVLLGNWLASQAAA